MEYKKTFITFGVILVSMASSAIPAHAEQIVVTVSDNGSGASNEVSVTSQSETAVTQNNSATIENNVTSNANTGDNSATGNTGGDSTITTGDITANTTVTNAHVNQNSAQAPNSGSVGGNISISGNGFNTNNNVTALSAHLTAISQNNAAYITNNATTNANTGNNNANWNSGDVTIKTGNISADTSIDNKRINNSIAKIVGGCNENCVISHDMILKIFGNGHGSVNNLTFVADESKTYTSNNLANIYNDAVHNLNTGGNSANKNTGDVTVYTGDIKSSITITNHDINSNYVEIDCGCEEKPEEPEEPTTPPTKPTPNGGSGGNGGVGGGTTSTSGDVLGAAIGEILPATGNLFVLWATIASLILFFSGWYLRFRSGCAPGLSR